MKKVLLFLILLVLSFSLVSAATLKGTVYNTNLEPETNVLVKISTIPEQRLLSRDGNYKFIIEPGTYTITAQKELITATEQIPIKDNGEYVFDLFLFPEGAEEEDLWNETEQTLIDEENQEKSQATLFIIVGLIIVVFIIVLWYVTSKRKKNKTKEEKETASSEHTLSEPHIPDAVSESESLEKTLEIIKNHDGRISQKDLRKEMMHLSEAKISLILTELEHKGKIEKIKKGRGNVVILR